MDAFLDREFEYPALEKVVRAARSDGFARMVVASLVLHLVTGAYLLAPGGSGKRPPEVVTFDLSSISLPQSPTTMTPPETPTAELPPEPVEIPQPPSLAESLNQTIRTAVAKAETTPDLLKQSSLGLGLSRGQFNSLAEGQTLRGDIRAYYFELLQRLNEAWWSKGGERMNPGKREALINVDIDRNGTLVGRMLMRSSGDPQLDRLIMAALDAAGPFPPLPASYAEPVFSAPLKLSAPLHLFSLSSEAP